MLSNYQHGHRTDLISEANIGFDRRIICRQPLGIFAVRQRPESRSVASALVGNRSISYRPSLFCKAVPIVAVVTHDRFLGVAHRQHEIRSRRHELEKEVLHSQFTLSSEASSVILTAVISPRSGRFA